MAGLARRARTGAALACALALPACGGDSTGPRSIELTLTVCSLAETKVCPATTVLPLHGLEVTVHIVPTNVAVGQLVIRATGVLVQSDTFIASPPLSGPSEAVDTLGVPADFGPITITATAQGGGVTAVSAPTTVAVADIVAPVVDAVSVTPADSVEPGDSLIVHVTAHDNAFLTRIVAQASGAFSAAETLAVFTQGGTFDLTFRVPPTAPLGSVASFAVHAIDIASLASNVGNASGPPFGDFTAPVVPSADLPATFYNPLVLQDTFHIAISASDEHRLAWVGYRLGEPPFFEDSVAVTDAAGYYPMTAIVTAGWIGEPRLQPFARDSSGNLGTYNGFFQLRVIDAIRRPTRYSGQTITLLDAVYDRKRDALYLLGGPGLGAIPLTTLEYAPMPIPSYSGISIDLTPSNDTLLMPVDYGLGIMDLTQSPPTIDTVPLAYDTSLGGPKNIAVAASNKVLITLATGFIPAQFLIHDLTTGQTQVRTDVGDAGTITTFASLVPSLDRARVALLWGFVDSGQVYQSASDAFSAARVLGVPNAWEGAATADNSGNRFLIGGTLYGSDFATLATFDYPLNPAYPNQPVASAITPDGQYAYFSQELGDPAVALVLKVRLSDNAVLERIRPPAFARWLFVTPDGTSLIGIAGAEGTYVMDLR